MVKKGRETVFVCAGCGNEYGKWQGQCSACGEWNSLKEAPNSKLPMSNKRPGLSGALASSAPTVINLGKKNKNETKYNIVFCSNIPELDRVLGKGIVQGQVILFAGEPGIGKSTLLTQLVGKLGGLYAAGEESAEQIGLRVERLGVDGSKIDVLATNDVDSIISYLERVQLLPKMVIVDSIQVMMTSNLVTGAGSPAQIRECTFRLVEAAKRLGVPIIIVGHVTKEGDIAGPKLLEHMVDTVLYFEGEKNGDLRILRAVKNRFGATDEVGIFRMEEKGLLEVKDLNLVENQKIKIGSAMTVLLEGNRPMVVELEALVTESFAPMPKRVFSGIDYNRGQLLVAVAQKVLGIPLYKFDVFISVTGGLKIEETGADLAIVAAMWSSYKNQAIKPGGSGSSLVLVGEVSLLGEVKKVKGMEKRQKEAGSLGMKVVEMRDVTDLRKILG